MATVQAIVIFALAFVTRAMVVILYVRRCSRFTRLNRVGGCKRVIKGW
jgi:hypothetical protein